MESIGRNFVTARLSAVHYFSAVAATLRLC
jgi:hypothetical protein